VGQPIRAIMLRLDGEFVPMINPSFTSLSSEMFEFEEECFSLYNVRGVVLRHQQVEVSYLDQYGNAQTRTMTGEESGLVQHEVDHLNGVFFLDRIEDHQRLQSIDYMLNDNPERLKVVKEMMAYMAG
jgi:peptide deformylase